ncbi:hypothetical protein HMPREF1049_1224 [Fusobacterium necrophorum subsp. funduliforme ATCC 51357]|uniref:Uncharacterized protein n=1 Tax=Fusobacterium necrophorum subsp. funduliforme TaxID=143387 RepID=A0A162IHR8_9FUSO|nr:hypothetical protein HMPREF1049_1224 [Fusobacterium necrophorum subsp. funduliforme ATCC 51357]KYL00757.1 hypothetical protein A2J07_07920 [Fusobacterium necrophorum subsp. funduliforme]KYM46772.1 hypothetical protein A2U05_07105 [Fusobacterium necrophorum subsp. funduliforme]KYM56064.1 hypothetical protein A2U14_07600 [Fusobacterium necrophorum subsp. funduliforme]KYM63658.1 hypothetical protein A2U16_07275 [Fusobacterium necrophorum subsp. funduliforme]
MSHHYSINTLLKIQDPNISFSDIPWEEKKNTWLQCAHIPCYTNLFHREMPFLWRKTYYPEWYKTF